MFDNPEKFQVCVYLWVAWEILSECPTIKKNWDNEFELTKAAAKKLINEFEECRD